MFMVDLFQLEIMEVMQSEIKVTNTHSCIRNGHLESVYKCAPKFQWEMFSKLKKTHIKLVTEQAIMLTVL